MTTFLKGDSSAEITLVLAEGCDYSGKTVHLEYQGARRSFSGVAAGGSLTFSFTAAETASMSLGAYPVRVWIEDENGGTVTIHNGAVKLRVTDCVADMRSDEAMYLDVRGGLHGLEGLPDRWNENDLKAKIDEIIRRLGGTVALLLVCALPAFCAGPLTVQTAPKGAVYNDAQIVTNVDFDVSALEAKADTSNTYTRAETDAAIARLAPAPDFTSANTQLKDTIKEVAPAPGNYAAVSNAAMTAAQTATNLVAAATNGIPTRADLDKGWWSEWTFSNVSASITDIQQPVFHVDYWSCGCMYSGELLFMWIEDAKETDTRLDFSFTAGGNDLHFTATRHRVAAPVPTKPEDIGAASTADATLAPVYSQTPTFSEWTILRDGVDVTSRVEQPFWDNDFSVWYISTLPGDAVDGDSVPDVADATTLKWNGYDTSDNYKLVTYTATRTRTDVVGYILGTQSNTVVTATNDLVKTQTLANYYTRAEAATTATNAADYAVATADTSYQRFTSETNLNQSVQYLTNAPNNILTIELPAGSAATKDWIVYAYFGIETPLLLPTAIWWMADEAYTNAIPPNTPTALYFSQVADGIFTLSRQELKSVEIVVP